MAIFSSFSSSATSWRRVPRWLRSLGRPRDLGSHCRDYVRIRLEQSPLEDDAEFTNDTINLARYALAHSSGNLEDKIDALMLLSGSIYEHLYRHTDVILLEEMISLGREALALCGTGHLQRQRCCGNLAAALKERFALSNDVHILEESINLEREALDLCHKRDPSRSMKFKNLAISLGMLYQHTNNALLLDESIDLKRKVLDLCPEGHSEHALSCESLAKALEMHYNCTGNSGSLDEAIDLQRKAFSLRPTGNSSRSSSCGDLAIFLKTRYDCTGDVSCLNEAITLEREALHLHPEGHPDRSSTCGNLSATLLTCYEHTGESHLLDESIDLAREALGLRPEGHLKRSFPLENLAISLRARYQRTGDIRLLDEAIDLQREVLSLQSAEHSNRARCCGNLAMLLSARYQGNGDIHSLKQAIDLQREALNLRSEGHPFRSISCQNLSALFILFYQRTGVGDLLDAAMQLEREALDLRPKGHPDRSLSCGSLAVSLRVHYQRCGDEGLLHEVITLQREAVEIAHVHAAWKHLCELAWVHLQTNDDFYDVSQAIAYLSRSLENEPDHIHLVVQALLERLEIVWDHDLHTEGRHIKLTTVYQRLVELMPLLAHPALGLQPQLQAMKKCSRLGSDAFVNAALAGNPTLGLEVLELAQGVIWSQSLHRRDPQLAHVPEQLARRLRGLLHAVGTGSAAESHHKEPAARNTYDALHADSSRLFALVREIRALPGLDRFMLGESFETLRAVASKHSVVVLVAARGYHYALIISPLCSEPALLTLDLSVKDNKALRSKKDIITPEHGGFADESDAARAMKMITPSRSDPLDQHMKALWHKVVKPVLDHLNLKVSGCAHSTLRSS
jgi:tetratricopeptide (TPR) repeat protein